ncbi:MAG: diacylglycerol kinase family protein [Candidatus Omnitrophota bacterium]
MKRLRFFRHIFRFHGFRESLLLALKGIGYLFLFHRNMRIIFLFGIAAFLAGVRLNFKGIELVALCITITLVFMAEMFNTAIELMINMFTRKYHPLIKLVKDISAAVVLIAALNSLGVGFVLFWRHLVK